MSIFYVDPETSVDASELLPLVSSLNTSIDEVSTPEEIYLLIDGIFSKMSLIISTDKLTLLSKLGVTTD